jgi:hypothetical protein
MDSATVAFLAIPDINALCRAVCLVSVLCAPGCISLSLYFVWKHQTEAKGSSVSLSSTLGISSAILICVSRPELRDPTNGTWAVKLVQILVH